ncbi:MAG: hypothetical protein ACI9FU_000525 [Granulosicoccus sp.]|jgi:hypothetical protein
MICSYLSTMTNQQKLLDLFDQMEADRQAMMAKVKGIDHSLLERKPNADAWSVSEVFMHMVVAEAGSLKYMRKKIEVDNHSVCKGRTAQYALLIGALKAPILKFKAPKIVADVGSGIQFSDAQKQWDEVRAELRTDYENLDEEWIMHDLFKHPSAGKFDLIRAVKFMRVHADRHIGQIHRTIKSLQ